MKMFKLMLVMTLGLPVLSALEMRKPALKLAGCPLSGYSTWSKVGAYCAKHFHQPHKFGEAELKCRSEHSHGHLISVHDRGTNEELKILTGSWHTEAWIGGYMMPCTKTLVWTDGSKWDYDNWVPGEPNGSGKCAQINWNTTGMFDDTECCAARSYVCAFPI